MNTQMMLFDYIAAVWSRPMDDGHDCARFADDWYRAVHGESLMPFNYRSQGRALARLRKMGFADHVAYLATRLEECPVALGQVGDIAAVPGQQYPALGIVQGEGIYAPMPTGKIVVPLTAAERMFRL
ncbi:MULTISPECIES: DUF6950 family protein [unclassified Haematobacter]|uniref:DUF6950 family protein n=1 Tax=unclassified Haematobacter TaxID=2640585 RepID=UPI0025BE2147|nr:MULTISPECIES: hypothetical protein [unclassified Haematobacter]